jgi:hypothetical protein
MGVTALSALAATHVAAVVLRWMWIMPHAIDSGVLA